MRTAEMIDGASRMVEMMRAWQGLTERQRAIVLRRFEHPDESHRQSAAKLQIDTHTYRRIKAKITKNAPALALIIK